MSDTSREVNEANVVLVSTEASRRYFQGLKVSEHYSPNGLKKTGSEPKPMTNTRGVAQLSE